MLLLNKFARIPKASSLLNSCLLPRVCSLTASCSSSIGPNTAEPKNGPEKVSNWPKQKHLTTPKYVHYLRLIRADKPIGSWLLFWPCAWSIGLGSPLAGTVLDVGLLALFGAGAFLMRSAGCVLNDLWDRDFDKQVERTKLRPLASGALSEGEAVAVLVALLSGSLAILCQLNWPSIALGSSSLFLVVLYPLAKRYTNWPQLVLGITFNWGALLGYTATTGQFPAALLLLLHSACVCWTLVYDTIYAHQDKFDDQRLGLGSTALHFGDKTGLFLTIFAAYQIVALGMVGALTEQLWPFYASLLVATSHLAWQLGTLRTDDTSDCWTKFGSNQWLGAAVFVGILLSNVLKREKDGGNDGEKLEGDELDGFMDRMESRNLNVNFYT